MAGHKKWQGQPCVYCGKKVQHRDAEGCWRRVWDRLTSKWTPEERDRLDAGIRQEILIADRLRAIATDVESTGQRERLADLAGLAEHVGRGGEPATYLESSWPERVGLLAAGGAVEVGR